MGDLMRAYDWGASAVGPVESWPQSLRTALSILLDSRYPMYVAWGPEFTQFYNDGYRPILGATKHPSALGRSTRETFAEIWDFIGPMFQEVMRSGSATYLEDQLLPLDRYGYVEECYFTFCYSAVRTESGAVGGVFVTCSETTERVIGERRLRTLRDLGATATTVQDVSAALERAAAALDTNPADIPFALMYVPTGADDARLVARTGLPSGHPAAPETFSLGPGAAWPSGGASDEAAIVVDDLAARFGRIDSRTWPEDVHSAVVVPIARSSQDGALDALLVLGLNPRRAFDDDYRAFVGLIAGQIGAAITAARAYEEERERAQALAELDHAKTTFFSNVSHEFRTPLTLMLGPIEDLLRRRTSALAHDDRETLELLHRNAQRLLKLVNTLLDFSRIEAGRVEVSFEPIDLARATADLASAFRAAVERAGLRLVVECHDVGEPVFVDASMWEKIVFNLLSNAFKYTLAGEIRVTLARVDAESVARLTVSDTGVGIAPDELPHVFERFRRVEGVRARTHEGSGIGLALVRELVWLHGGHVDVTSTEGEGTTFSVDIPLGRAHLPDDRIHAPRERASTAIGPAPFVDEVERWLPERTASTPPAAADRAIEDSAMTPEVRRSRIMVVDDNTDMRAYLSALLAPHYVVDVAADGAEALAQIRRQCPDLVVSDIMMPVLGGLELVQALRGDPETAAIPIILLSARAGEESTVEGLASGADDYLVKPFAARELLARVRAHIKSSEATRRERARLVALFDRAPAFMAVLRGPEHVIEAANAAYLTLVGRDDVVGRRLFDVLPELVEQGFRDLLDEVLTTGEPHVGREASVMLVRTPGGEPEESYVDFVYHPLRESDGRVTGVFVQGVDVTEQVRARQEVQRLYESVRDANETKRQFLAAMSHELRTPLNAVIGYADLLALGIRGDLTDMQRADVERIRAASRYLLTLITDILNFSRVEAGQITLHAAPVSVDALVASVCALMQPHIEQRGIAFEVDPVDPRLTVIADQERLQQILLNLLMNASKFTPAGGRIRLWAEPRDRVVHVYVQDTGVGIPAADLEHIFEPFVQLDRRASKESQQGVGLGLAISRDLARRMNGDVLVESERGRGARFTVVVPRAG